jgi:hypothetical protein
VIQLVNKQHTEGKLAGKWDLYVYDRSIEGDLLVSSDQGYENRLEVEKLVERLFAGRFEEVDLLTLPASGTGGSHRMIR